MFKRLLPSVLLLVVPVLLHAQSTQTPLPEKAAGEIYKTAGPSVVLIETYGEDGKVSGSGSGFLVTAEQIFM
jgi:hypothetical protein